VSRGVWSVLTVVWLICALAVKAEPEPAEPEGWQKAGLLAALEDPSREVLIAAITDEDAKRMLPYLTEDVSTVVPILVDLLADPLSNVRQAAVAALGALRAKEQAAAIAARLEDPDPNVRGAAVLAIRELAPVDTRVILLILEAAHRSKELISPTRYLAHRVAGDNQDSQTAVAWLGKPVRIPAPKTDERRGASSATF